MSIYTKAADKLSAPEIACAAHATINELKQALYSPYMSWLLEEKVIHGGMRFLGMEETTNLLAVMGLVRGGVNLPTAAGWITAVREQGIFAPVHIARIECRRNGRTFAFLNDHANDAAEAAGPVLFQVTIDFDGYRAAFREALAARQPSGEQAAA